MNPFDLDATGLMIWGLVAHLVADWPLQNDWMANNKAKRRQKMRPEVKGILHDRYGANEIRSGDRIEPYDSWSDRHPAAYVHAGIHGLLLAPIFGLVAVILALVHLVIDCRWVVVKWSQLIGQTQPSGERVFVERIDERGFVRTPASTQPLYDVGTEVRFWTDQVFHIATIAVAALIVGAL